MHSIYTMPRMGRFIFSPQIQAANTKGLRLEVPAGVALFIIRVRCTKIYLKEAMALASSS